MVAGRRAAALGFAGLLALLVWWAWDTEGPRSARPSSDDPTDPRSAGPSAVGDVQCELEVAPGPRRVTVVEHDPDTLDPLGRLDTTVDHEWLVFRPRHPEGLGWLTVAGYRPVAIGWAGGACLEWVPLVADGGETVLYGRVAGAVQSGDVVSGCDRGHVIEADGTFELHLEST